jgi:hypothetical protein
VSIATTAELIVEIIGRDLLSPATASAERGLSTMSGTSLVAAKSASTAEKALGLVGSAASGMGNALNHAKGFLSGLISGPLGFLGLGLAVGGVGMAFEKSISSATALGNSLFKLNALTGMSYESLSALIAVGEKYGLTQDAMTTSIAFGEKTLGKLAETAGKAAKSQASLNLEAQKQNIEAKGGSVTAIDKLITKQTGLDEIRARSGGTVTKLTALEQQYGISLTDSSGKVVDYQTEILRLADYYTSNATAGQKAALASTLLGRGYANLAPLLSLGSQGILDAEAAAKNLGETLTTQNAVDLKNYGATMRELSATMGGLSLQISLALLPAVTDVAKAFTGWLQNGGKDQIIAFLKQVISVGQDVAHTFTSVVVPALVSIGGLAKSAWNAIPGPLQTLLIEALVGNKVLKTVFGINILGTVEGAVANIGKDLLTSLFKSTIATPVVNVDGAVVNVGGVPGVGGAAGAGEGAAAAGGGILTGVSGAVIGVASVAAAAVLLVNANQGRNNLANAAAAGDPIATRTQNELATRGFQNPTAGGSSGTTDALTGIKEAVLKTGQMTVDGLTGVKEADTLGHLTVSTALAHLTGLTLAQMEKVIGNLQLQRVATLQTGQLTYKQLLAQSTLMHTEHAEHMAKLDGISLKEERVKLAVDATTAAVKKGLSISVLQTIQAVKDKGSSIKVNIPVSTRDVNTARVLKARIGPDRSAVGLI